MYQQILSALIAFFVFRACGTAESQTDVVRSVQPTPAVHHSEGGVPLPPPGPNAQVGIIPVSAQDQEIL